MKQLVAPDLERTLTQISRLCHYLTLNISETAKGKALLTMECEQETIPKLLSGHFGAVVQLVEYWTRNQEVAGSTHTRSIASNHEQVANLLCAQANSASYPQRDGKCVVAMATG